jgi:hypothetical protein
VAEEWDQVYFLHLKSQTFIKADVTPDLKLNADPLAWVASDYVGGCTFGTGIRR